MVIVGLEPADCVVRTRAQAHADSEDEANGTVVPVQPSLRPASTQPEQIDQWAAGQDGEVRGAVRWRRSRVEACKTDRSEMCTAGTLT